MRRLLAVTVLALGVGTAAADDPPAEPAPLTRADLDKRLRRTAHEVTTAGVELFNAGDHEGCYRLFDGALTVMVPLLDHKPELARKLKDSLSQAKGLTKASEKAVLLREGLDAVMGVKPPVKADAKPPAKMP